MSHYDANHNDKKFFTVAQLIEALQAMPQDATPHAVYDGFCHIYFDRVWVSNSGHVVLAESGEVIYHDEDRPEAAPKEAGEPHWEP